MGRLLLREGKFWAFLRWYWNLGNDFYDNDSGESFADSLRTVTYNRLKKPKL